NAQRALMQALAAGGNYAAAILTYRELRLRLHREVNVEPDTETQALFEQLRAEARGGAASSAGWHGPPDRETAHGASILLAHSMGNLAPSRDARPHNLLAQPTPLIGRERAVAAARELLLQKEV